MRIVKEKIPLVTVIVPAYNSEKYIGRCLESILEQSFDDFELLVIDDGSTDGTGKIVKEYAKYDERVIYKKQKNMGVAKTRNKAVKMARGEFVAFIDNDDFINKNYLETLLPRRGEDIVISGYRRPDENGKVRVEVKLEDASWSRFLVVAPWAKIYRKEFIIENKLEFLDNNIGEDVYFNLVAMLLTKKIRISDYVGYNWFYNEGSVSNTSQRSYEEIKVFKLLDGTYEQLEKRKLLKKNYDILELYFYRYVVWFLMFAAKGAKMNEITSIYDSLFKWLKDKFPDYEKNKLLKGRLPGEIISTRFTYKTFLMFQKVRLGKVLVWLYAKV